MSSALAELVVKLVGDTSEFEDSMKKAGSSMEGVGSKIGAAGAAIGTAVVAGVAVAGAALVGLGATSIGIASDFQSQMAIMSTAVDPLAVGAADAAGAMEILGAAALQVGSDTALVGVSASGSAEAITGLYKAGMTTAEIFGDLNGYMAGTAELGGALRASIDLAAASELDMVGASDLAAVTLATFGGELTTAAERSDFVNNAMNNFVQTADASVASVQSLADAFVNVGPTAAAMGMGVETVNTALAIMSTRGITGAEAGTQLKSMLLGMQADASKAGGAMAELGVSLYDATGAMRPLPDVMADLESAMAGMTEQQRNQYVATIAGSYGMNAMNALLGEGAAGWADMEGAIAGAATMQETAAARSQTFQGVMESLAGVVEGFRIQVGTALLPALSTLAELGSMLMEKYGPVLAGVFVAVGAAMTGVVEAVTGFIGGFESGTPVVENVATLITNLGTAFGLSEGAATGLGTAFLNAVGAVTPFVTAVAGFVTSHGPQLLQVLVAIGIALGAFVIISTVVGWITGLMGAWTALGAAVTTAGGGLTGVVALLGGPVTIVIAAVAAAIGLLAVAWANNWGGIQEKVQVAWAAIQAAVGAGLAWLQANVTAVVGAVVAWWNAAWPGILATLRGVWTGIQAAIQAAVGVIGPAVQGMVEAIRGAFTNAGPIIERFKGLWASLGPLFQALGPVVQLVGQVIGGALAALGVAFVAIVGVVVGVVNGIVGAMGPLVSGIMGAIQAVIGIFTGLITFVTGMWNTIVGLFTGNSQLVQQGMQQMGAGIVAIWTNLVDGVTALVSGLVGAVEGFVRGLVEGVIGFFTSLYQTLVGGSIVPDLVNAVVAWFENLSAWLLGIVEGIRGFMEGVWGAIRGVIETATGAIRGVIEAGWSAVRGFWETTWGAIEAKTTAVWGAIRGVIETATGAIRGVIQSFTSTVQGVWNGFLGGLYNAWKTGWDGIRNVMEAGRGALTGIANAIVSAIFGVFNRDWGSIGRGIVDGIGNALVAGLQWVADKAREIAEAALKAAMEALGIGSPSKEFAYLGEMSVRGFTDALRDVRPIERAVVRGMGAGLGAGARAVERPVDRRLMVGAINVNGVNNGLSLLRQVEALGVRR